MKVLVACEFSGIVRQEFASLDHQVTSCDFLPTMKPLEEDAAHFRGDVTKLLAKAKFDLMIAHPPCTYLAASGARWFAGREIEQKQALEFFMALANAPVEKIAIENPVGVVSRLWRHPDQIIQPWMFGHKESKTTCLWLKNLPLLEPTDIIEPTVYGCSCGARFDKALGKYGCPNCLGNGKTRLIFDNQTPTGQNSLGKSPRRAMLRSITYKGIARAMALQWGL